MRRPFRRNTMDAGTPMKQLRLADTLDQLAQAGFQDFYRGDVAIGIAADLERIGSPVTRRDTVSSSEKAS